MTVNTKKSIAQEFYLSARAALTRNSLISYQESAAVADNPDIESAASSSGKTGNDGISAANYGERHENCEQSERKIIGSGHD